MKKIVRIAFIAVVAAVAGLGVYTSQGEEIGMSDVALANVEALADYEVTITWTCDGWWGSCSAYCGLCGTKVQGDGSLKGYHQCHKTD